MVRIHYIMKDLKLVHGGPHRHYQNGVPFLLERKTRELQMFIDELKQKPEDPKLLNHLTYDPSLDPIIDELEEMTRGHVKAHAAIEMRLRRNLTDLRV